MGKWGPAVAGNADRSARGTFIQADSVKGEPGRIVEEEDVVLLGQSNEEGLVNPIVQCTCFVRHDRGRAAHADKAILGAVELWHKVIAFLLPRTCRYPTYMGRQLVAILWGVSGGEVPSHSPIDDSPNHGVSKLFLGQV